MYPTYLVLLVSENIAVSDQMPGEADPQQVEETNIELQVNANSQGNTTQFEPLKDFFLFVLNSCINNLSTNLKCLQIFVFMILIYQ